jgi:hypothetical protein
MVSEPPSSQPRPVGGKPCHSTGPAAPVGTPRHCNPNRQRGTLRGGGAPSLTLRAKMAGPMTSPVPHSPWVPATWLALACQQRHAYWPSRFSTHFGLPPDSIACHCQPGRRPPCQRTFGSAGVWAASPVLCPERSNVREVAEHSYSPVGSRYTSAAVPPATLSAGATAGSR